MAGLSLKKLLPEFPDVEVEKVELLGGLSDFKEAGIKMIPVFVSSDKKLSGVWVTKKSLREFLEGL